MRLRPITQEFIDLLLDPKAEMLDRHQIRRKWQRRKIGDYQLGELMLMAAVLIEALMTLSDAADKNMRLSLGAIIAERRSVMSWVNSNDETWPMSFVNICENLGLDSGCVRKSIKAKYGYQINKIAPIPLICKEIIIDRETWISHRRPADVDWDYNNMYRLGSFLYMGGQRLRMEAE